MGSAACAVDADKNGDEVETTSEALSFAQCRRAENSDNPACFVDAVVSRTLAGEIDPYDVGDACIIWARDIGSSRVWGLVEDFDTCTQMTAVEGAEGSVVRFHKSQISLIGGRARATLKSFDDSAVYYRFTGAFAEIDSPDNAFSLTCKPVGDPCRREASLGYCLGEVRISQFGEEKIAVFVREGSARDALGRSYAPRSPSLGGRSDDGALPESLSFNLDRDTWVELELDGEDVSKMKGSFSFREAVRFPGEFESIAIECEGQL
jgi:hypothetical protein